MNEMHESDQEIAEERARGPREMLDRMAVLFQLGKGGLSLFVVMTTVVGFVVASRGGIAGHKLLVTVIGTGLTSWGALALNQWWEVARDAAMRRTRKRPLPSGRMAQRPALALALLAVAVGLAVLAFRVNLMTAALGLLTVVLYILAYTPLKPHTPLCTLVGALCGGIPPIMGWAAAAGRVEIGGWILGATLFTWQIPHFLALAWLYREDYARGGFRMLPVVDRSGQVTFQTVVLYILALIPMGFAVTYVGMAGLLFMFGSFVLGSAMLFLGVRLYLQRTDANARILFFASLIYLPALFVLLLADRGMGG
jgi:protoheme IX farnesyltransferase